jgi:uncharacterized protein
MIPLFCNNNPGPTQIGFGFALLSGQGRFIIGHMKRLLLFGILGLSICSLLIAGEAPTALIIDGQNNHAWQATTPVLKNILEEEGLFRVEVATTPGKGEDMSGFTPDFSRYQLVVLNYVGDPWPASVNTGFTEFIRAGGGCVVFHAANNAFPEWREFNEIIGLGGWGGRDETSGPYLRLRDGRWVPDMTPGKGGSHGRQHPYVVKTWDREHPIMRGLPAAWMHVQDELYDRLRGPARNLSVLAYAFADAELGGSGEEEPVLFTIAYGKGRVFHTTLGHGPEAMSCVGFIVTLRRGAEWAATGKVKDGRLPPDFPTEESTRTRAIN